MINRERIDENTNQRAISRIDLKDTKSTYELKKTALFIIIL